MRNSMISLGVAAAAIGLWALTPFGEVVSQSVESVLVTNFPDIQQVSGEVRIQGPIQLSRLERFEDVLIPPVRPEDTTRLVEAGTLHTAGFPQVVLSLHGLVRGELKQPGDVGVLLVPDEPQILQAFNEVGQVHFALQASAGAVSHRTPYFASTQPSFRVGFKSYRVYLYNTTDKSVTVNVYAYLTN